MDIKQVQELVKIINKTNISEISIEEEGLKITIRQKDDPAPQIIAQPMAPMVAAAPMPAAQPAPVAAPAAPPAKPAPAADNLITIKSPMIGTFYRSSAPDKPVFVNIGDEVGVGKVVCIIEAMKLFNESR
ncbi:MAG: acetyl-CoA carboxylase biotin carboxyl carrier protein [Chitinophagaceae bacterium]|nr:acetyl-CoA carboxylase biotin carboxyl carrier protein [Chitinophagaceae bacterium]